MEAWIVVSIYFTTFNAQWISFCYYILRALTGSRYSHLKAFTPFHGRNIGTPYHIFPQNIALLAYKYYIYISNRVALILYK